MMGQMRSGKPSRLLRYTVSRTFLNLRVPVCPLLALGENGGNIVLYSLVSSNGTVFETIPMEENQP
jgi:hypothetical protein